MKIVAVTSCATGIAHTYMAAEALERAAKAAGHEIWVETQGAGGLKPIPADIIAAADVCIFANDIGVRDAARFAELPTVKSIPKQAIKDAAGLIAQAEELVAAK
jgi:PTS system fructose-specific IIC component